MLPTKRIIALGFFVFNILFAKEPVKYKALFQVANKNNKEVLTLFASLDFDKPVEGYFIISKSTDLITGSIKKRGIDFLSDNIFGGQLKFMVGKWVQNGFPIRDLETVVNGIDISAAIAFNIQPYIKDEKSGAIGLAAKFAVYSDIDKKNSYSTDYNLKLLYKLVYTEWNKKTMFDFLTPYLDGQFFTVEFQEEKKDENILTVQQSIYNEIKKSVAESQIKNSGFDFSLLHWFFPTICNPNGMNFYNEYYYLNYRAGFEKITSIAAKKNLLDTLELHTPIYSACYSLPFFMQNKIKDAEYKKYKSYQKVMQSNYSVIIIPIVYWQGSLTLDLIVDYSKLSLNDNIARWSPFKKRITIKTSDDYLSYSFLGEDRFIEMPEENWSANFSIGNDKYNIYGYPDYNKTIKEFLFIKLDDVSEEE